MLSLKAQQLATIFEMQNGKRKGRSKAKAKAKAKERVWPEMSGMAEIKAT